MLSMYVMCTFVVGELRAPAVAPTGIVLAVEEALSIVAVCRGLVQPVVVAPGVCKVDVSRHKREGSQQHKKYK